jgi:hypothetical protein
MTSFVADRNIDRHPTCCFRRHVRGASTGYVIYFIMVAKRSPAVVEFSTAASARPYFLSHRLISPKRKWRHVFRNRHVHKLFKIHPRNRLPAHGYLSRAKHLGAIPTISVLPSSPWEQYGRRQMNNLHPELRNFEKSSSQCDLTVNMMICKGLGLRQSRICMFFGSTYAVDNKNGGGRDVPAQWLYQHRLTPYTRILIDQVSQWFGSCPHRRDEFG